MSKYVVLNNGVEVKKAPIGFSWTSLFFGFFVPLIRGDIRWGIIQFLTELFSWGLSNIVWAFIYNKISLKSLLKRGYLITDYVGTTQAEVSAWTGFLQVSATEGPAKCGCGRSDTGYCTGLHKLSEAEWALRVIGKKVA